MNIDGQMTPPDIVQPTLVAAHVSHCGFFGCLCREKYSLIFRSCRRPSEGNWCWFGGNRLFLLKEAKQAFDLALLMLDRGFG